MKFLLKFLALPEGGGSEFLQKLQKKFYAASCSVSLLKISKVRKIEFLPKFCRNSSPPPPPFGGQAQNFEKKFHFRGRSTSEFSLNWEGFSNFHTISVAFSKSHFFELSVTFFPQFGSNFCKNCQIFCKNCRIFCNLVVGQTTKRASLPTSFTISGIAEWSSTSLQWRRGLWKT